LGTELSTFRFSDYELFSLHPVVPDSSYHQYRQLGNFNWKVFLDGCQEGYRINPLKTPVNLFLGSKIARATAYNQNEPEPTQHSALSRIYNTLNHVKTNVGDWWCRHFIDWLSYPPTTRSDVNRRHGPGTPSPSPSSPSADSDGFVLPCNIEADV
jgi:hypothetical protein